MRIQKVAEAVQSRRSRESTKELMLTRQKSLVNVLNRLQNETHRQRQMRLQKTLKSVRHRLLTEDAVHRAE